MCALTITQLRLLRLLLFVAIISRGTVATGLGGTKSPWATSKSALHPQFTGDEDALDRLLSFLGSVSALGGELRAAGDSWLQAKAAVVDSAAARLRSIIQPAAQRLKETLRQRCSQPAFAPPRDLPATIRGPGLSFSLRRESCYLRRDTDALRRDTILTCTEPGEVISRTVPRYTSAYTGPATFTAAECKTQYRFGLAATVTVDLWQPGEKPEDVVARWQARVARWRQEAAKKQQGRRLVSEDPDAGADTAGDVADGDGLALLVKMHELPATVLESALASHRESLRAALADWELHASELGGDGPDLQAAHPGSRGAVAGVAAAVGELLTDLGYHDASERFRRRLLGSAPAGRQQAADTDAAEVTAQAHSDVRGDGTDEANAVEGDPDPETFGSERAQAEGSPALAPQSTFTAAAAPGTGGHTAPGPAATFAAAGGPTLANASEQPGSPYGPAGPPEDVPPDVDGLDDGAGDFAAQLLAQADNVTHVFDLVAEAGLEAIRAGALASRERAERESGSGGGAAAWGPVVAAGGSAGSDGAGMSQGGSGSGAVGDGESSKEVDCCVTPAELIMREIEMELQRLTNA